MKKYENVLPKKSSFENIIFSFVVIATVIYTIPTSVTCETEMKWNIYDVWDGTQSRCIVNVVARDFLQREALIIQRLT